MSFDERAAKAALIKQVRRAIIDCLKLVYPEPFSFEAIESAVLHLEVSAELLKKDLEYFLDKGLVRWVNQPQRNVFMAWAKRMYKLTPAGVDVADAIVRDPSLEP